MKFMKRSHKRRPNLNLQQHLEDKRMIPRMANHMATIAGG